MERSDHDESERMMAVKFEILSWVVRLAGMDFFGHHGNIAFNCTMMVKIGMQKKGGISE